MKSSKGKIYRFLRDNAVVTLAFIGKDGKPEAASIKYVLDGDSLLVDITSSSYRAYIDHLKDSQIACVVSEDRITLQFQAHCHVLDGDRATDAKHKLAQKHPKLAEHFNPKSKFFMITPIWMRMQDYNKNPIEQVFYESPS